MLLCTICISSYSTIKGTAECIFKFETEKMTIKITVFSMRFPLRYKYNI